ncbi:MAG: DUF2085 domain-containing protein [Candidatus Thorarchaeota archaeon]
MNTIVKEVEKTGYLRLIFLNLLISLFIIISYIYTSEFFGSISTIFISSQEFIISFGFTLLLFTFLSVLAGSIHGLFDGFIAEILYQLAFYHQIHIEWCLIIAVLGFTVGFYKYRPKKYHERIKIFYSFLALVISVSVVSGVIILSHLLLLPNQIPLEILIINYAFKFFTQALISIIFIVPTLLVLYDRVFAASEKQLYYIFLTHHPISASDHTFYLKFGSTKVFFCSRCSGVVLGGLTSMFLTYLLERIFRTELSGEIALILILILPIPAITDWGSQRLLLRKSTTSSRLFTGFILGSALHIMSFTYRYYMITLSALVIYFSIFFVLVYFGQKKEMKLLREEDYPYLSKQEEE